MASNNSGKAVRGTIEDLLFNQDPETRSTAAATLGGSAMCVADEREALEALTTALQDPSTTVQEAVLQSLVRLSAK